MSIDIKQFEIDRVVNMMRSFGWSVVKTEKAEDKVTITMEKIIKAEIPKV